MQSLSQSSSDVQADGDDKNPEILKASEDNTAEKPSAAHDEEVKEDNSVSAASATDEMKMSKSAEKKKARKQKV